MRPIAVGVLVGLLKAMVVIGAIAPLWYQLSFHPPRAFVLLYLFSLSFFEELLFRSVVLTAIWNANSLLERRQIRHRRFFILLVVLVQGVIFGAVHFFDVLSWIKFAVTAISGIIYGLLAWRFKSLWPGVFAHATFNLMVITFIE